MILRLLINNTAKVAYLLVLYRIQTYDARKIKHKKHKFLCVLVVYQGFRKGSKGKIILKCLIISSRYLYSPEYSLNIYQFKINNAIFLDIISAKLRHITPHHHPTYQMLASFINPPISGFGSLEVACWPLIPKFAGSNPAEAVGFFRAKKSSARLPTEGK